MRQYIWFTHMTSISRGDLHQTSAHRRHTTAPRSRNHGSWILPQLGYKWVMGFHEAEGRVESLFLVLLFLIAIVLEINKYHFIDMRLTHWIKVAISNGFYFTEDDVLMIQVANPDLSAVQDFTPTPAARELSCTLKRYIVRSQACQLIAKSSSASLHYVLYFGLSTPCTCTRSCALTRIYRLTRIM